MRTIKTVLAVVVMVWTLAAPTSAKSIWDELNETAPLQPMFDTLRDTAP